MISTERENGIGNNTDQIVDSSRDPDRVRPVPGLAAKVGLKQT